MSFCKSFASVSLAASLTVGGLMVVSRTQVIHTSHTHFDLKICSKADSATRQTPRREVTCPNYHVHRHICKRSGALVMGTGHTHKIYFKVQVLGSRQGRLRENGLCSRISRRTRSA